MRTPWLVGIVIAAHVIAAVLIVLLPGCGTLMRPEVTVVEPPTQKVPQEVPAVKKTVLPGVSEWPPASTETSTYIVKNGDSLSKIASRYGLSTKELAAVNGITNPDKIVLGQKLIIPSPGSGESIQPGETTTPPKEAPLTASGNVYVVQKNDSLSVIAYRHKVKLKELKELNSLTSDKIIVGQKLQLPSSAVTPAAVTKTTPATTAVPPVKPVDPKSTDTLDSAPITTTGPAKVSVPAKKTTTVSAPAVAPGADEFRMYVVEEDDDLHTIAMMWNVSEAGIKALNGMTGNEVKAGQKLKIPLVD